MRHPGLDAREDLRRKLDADSRDFDHEKPAAAKNKLSECAHRVVIVDNIYAEGHQEPSTSSSCGRRRAT